MHPVMLGFSPAWQAIGIGVGVTDGVGLGVGVGEADGVGLGDGVGVEDAAVQTARSGLTDVLLATDVTAGLPKVGTASPPFNMATVPVGET